MHENVLFVCYLFDAAMECCQFGTTSNLRKLTTAVSKLPNYRSSGYGTFSTLTQQLLPEVREANKIKVRLRRIDIRQGGPEGR